MCVLVVSFAIHAFFVVSVGVSWLVLFYDFMVIVNERSTIHDPSGVPTDNLDVVKCDEEDSDHVQDKSWLSLSDVVDHSAFIGHKNLIVWSSTMQSEPLFSHHGSNSV